MKKNIIIAIVTLVMLFGAMYIGTIKDGWYLEVQNGVETHWFTKTDMFGNKWITGSKSFYLRSR